MGDIYIGCRLVSTKAAKQHFEVFGWLIENFSEKLGLPNARLYPLSESELLASVPQGADDMPEDWIQKQFTNLKNYSHMDQWPISFSNQARKQNLATNARLIKNTAYLKRANLRIKKTIL